MVLDDAEKVVGWRKLSGVEELSAFMGGKVLFAHSAPKIDWLKEGKDMNIPA